MKTNQLSWRGLLVITLALVGASACGSSSNDSTMSDAGGNSPMDDAGGEAAGDAGTDAASSATAKNIVETAVAAGSFKTLAGALVQTGLDKALAGDGPFTVFAPTDAAFDALGKEKLSSLSSDELATILKYHVVPGKVTSKDLKTGPVESLAEYSLFAKLGDSVMINDAKVTTADVEASNGVIHVIDKVLLPPDLVKAATYAGGFDTLLAAATRAELAGALSADNANLTVFAPTDEAFMSAGITPSAVASTSPADLAKILKYHVVMGEVLSKDLKAGPVPTLEGADVTIDLSNGVKVNDATVVVPDVKTTNGVIHVIDKVLMPPSN